MLAEAESEGMPHFSTVPWKAQSNQYPHTCAAPVSLRGSGSGAGLRSVRAARDGYVYGDHVPDYIFLLMESQNDFGGESFFVESTAMSVFEMTIT